jgi:hypothetical protein
MKAANRQAKDRRDQQFESLAAFANMGDSLADWQKFRLKYPDFFPVEPSGAKKAGFRNLTEWLYSFAEEWTKEDTRSLQLGLPPLLWYRDILRAVWAGNDQTGGGLYVLYGYEKKSREFYVPVRNPLVRPLMVPGQLNDPLQKLTSGLPQGEPVINGLSGDITWKFGCELQQSVYELMKCRWRARVCLEDGVFFVAGKTAQTFCSTRCSGEAKRKRALDYWNREGKLTRDMLRKKGTGK